MKVAFFDIRPFEKNFLESRLDSCFEPYYYKEHLNSETVLDEKAKTAEVLSVFIDSDLSKKVLEKFPNLKYIVLRSVGYSHCDLFYAKKKGICVFNAPHYGDNSIAEYVFGLLLSASKRIVKASSDLKNQNVNDILYQGVELYGKTIGIIGLGAIGKRIAEIAKGFSLNVIYNDIKKDENYCWVTLDELCEKSDIISINCPLTNKTLHLIDENKFQLMKKGVIIINTARGEIIKSSALYDALLSKKIGFVGLDVVECESLFYTKAIEKINLDKVKEDCLKNFYVTRKLFNMDNVLITPHIAYNTLEAKLRILEITLENLISLTKFTNGAKNLVLV